MADPHPHSNPHPPQTTTTRTTTTLPWIWYQCKLCGILVQSKFSIGSHVNKQHNVNVRRHRRSDQTSERPWIEVDVKKNLVVRLERVDGSFYNQSEDNDSRIDSRILDIDSDKKSEMDIESVEMIKYEVGSITLEEELYCMEGAGDESQRIRPDLKKEEDVSLIRIETPKFHRNKKPPFLFPGDLSSVSLSDRLSSVGNDFEYPNASSSMMITTESASPFTTLPSNPWNCYNLDNDQAVEILRSQEISGLESHRTDFCCPLCLPTVRVLQSVKSFKQHYKLAHNLHEKDIPNAEGTKKLFVGPTEQFPSTLNLRDHIETQQVPHPRILGKHKDIKHSSASIQNPATSSQTATATMTCDICTLRFNSNLHLQYHQLTHTAYWKLLTENETDRLKALMRSNNVLPHLKVFHCPFLSCPKSFKNFEDFFGHAIATKHIRGKHIREKPPKPELNRYICPQCNKSYFYKCDSQFKKHMRSSHRLWLATDSDWVFIFKLAKRSEPFLTVRQPLVTFQCDMCPKVSISKKILRFHKLGHTPYWSQINVDHRIHLERLICHDYKPTLHCPLPSCSLAPPLQGFDEFEKHVTIIHSTPTCETASLQELDIGDVVLVQGNVQFEPEDVETF